MPAEFVADRMFMRPVTTAGRALLLFADSGGGTSFLWKSTVLEIGIDTAVVHADGEALKTARWPAWQDAAGIPVGPQAFVLPLEKLGREAEILGGTDGFLGQNWFADRVWLLDYPARSAAVWEGEGSPPVAPGFVSMPISFPADEVGTRPQSFARMKAAIDGEVFDFLFDTGATLVVRRGVRAPFGGAALQATSFIVQSIFDRWRQRHPEWRIVKDADALLGGDAIEVPELLLGELRIGPVWFTARRDENFHVHMSQWMDRRIDGALGGSAWRYVRMIVDYRRAVCHLGMNVGSQTVQRPSSGGTTAETVL